jgi:hypothetical protein
MLDPKKGGRPEMGRAYCCAAHCISCVFFPPYKMGNVNREEGQPYRKYQEVTKMMLDPKKTGIATEAAFGAR